MKTSVIKVNETNTCNFTVTNQIVNIFVIRDIYIGKIDPLQVWCVLTRYFIITNASIIIQQQNLKECHFNVGLFKTVGEKKGIAKRHLK